MKTQTLYQIQNDYQDILARLEESFERDDLDQSQIDALNAELEINAAEFREKADAYAAVIGQKMARAEYLKTEAKRLVDMAKAEEKAAERLRERISAAMTQQGLDKAETAHYKLSFRKSQAIEINCLTEELPGIYQASKIVYSPDKDAIKRHILMGGMVPGAVLVERQNLQIR